MIIATHGILASAGGIVYDADAQAFFDRVTTAGGSLSNTEKTAVNQLVLDMKSYSIWSKMKAIYPMVGASSAACAQNLKSSSFTGNFSGGWTYASTGITGNGTTGYMDTGLSDNVNLSLNSAHLSIYSRTNSDGLMCDIGCNTASSNETNIYAKYLNTFYPRIHNDNAGVSNSVNSLGLFISNRVNSSEIRASQNGNLKIITNTSNNTGSNNVLVGALNASNVRYFSNRQYAFASIGDGLTDTEASNFYTAVNAFQVSLSRNV